MVRIEYSAAANILPIMEKPTFPLPNQPYQPKKDQTPSDLTDNINELEFKEVANTVCDHEWAEGESDPNSNMRSEVCKKCWAGRSIPV